MDSGNSRSGKFGFPALRLKSEFDAVKENGNVFKTGLFTLLCLPDSTLSCVHCGIICSRKFHVRAVRRNRAKRLLREALRTAGPEQFLPGRILLIPRRSILEKSMPEVREHLFSAMRKAGFLSGGSRQDV